MCQILKGIFCYFLIVFPYSILDRENLFIKIFFIFWRVRVCWPLRYFCRPFCIFEICLIVWIRTQRAAPASRRATNKWSPLRDYQSSLPNGLSRQQTAIRHDAHDANHDRIPSTHDRMKQKHGRQEILQCIRESTYTPVGTPSPPPPPGRDSPEQQEQMGCCTRSIPPPHAPPPHSQQSPYRINFLSYNAKKVLYNWYNTCLQYTPTVHANSYTHT